MAHQNLNSTPTTAHKMTINDDIFGIGTKQIMDPVHGGFRVYSHELKIIDSPLFQRLRFIKQNDVANLVFPGALHTRFQHSLGVMHIAGRVYRSVIMNHLNWTAATRTTPLSQETANSIRYFYFCFRLAALMHDTGHFPFSHEFEKSAVIKNVFKDSCVLNFLELPENTTHVARENYSLI
jgi:HD superfamily phosphohydrolase